MKTLRILAVSFLASVTAIGQNATCPTSQPVCSMNSSSFAMTNGGSAISPGSNVSNPGTSPINAINGQSISCFLSNGPSPNWFVIYPGSTGLLQFTIGGAGGSGCFDWMLWEVDPNNPNATCAGITNLNTVPPVACNWNPACNGFTGMLAAGSPTPPGGNAGNFTTSIPVTPGEAYMLCFSNYSGLSGNANLNFPTGPGIASVTCNPNTPDQTICLGQSATVNITATGQPITAVNWITTTGVSNTSGITGVIVTPTVTTDYIIGITQGGTTINDTFRINVIQPPALNAGMNQTVCLGSPIFLSGTPATAPYTLQWNTMLPTGLTPAATASFAPNFSSPTPTVTVNQPGVYQFILKHTHPTCGPTRDTVQVTVSQLNISATTLPSSCNGTSDGTITITSAGASEYSFNNGATWGPANSQSTFVAGTYTVCARNTLGCQRCTTAVVSNPAPVTLTVSPDVTICENGTAPMTATGGGGTSFTYIWGHSTAATVSSTTISPLATAYYDVIAVNQNGCQSPPDSILVTVRPPISLSISTDPTVCPLYPGSLTVTATGGDNGPYNFVWNTGASNSGLSSTLTDSPANSSLYSVTVTDGCESTPKTISGNIFTHPLPVPQILVDEPIQCDPGVFVVSNGTDPAMSASTSWKISNGDEVLNAPTITSSSLPFGNYDVHLIVISPQGCIDSAWFTNALIVKQQPTANFNWSPNPLTMFSTTALYSNLSQNADSYEWFFQGGSPMTSDEFAPSSTYPEGVVTNYETTLIAHSDLGCSDTLTKIVSVVPEVIIFAPNAFTPDGDEFNQSWKVILQGIDVYDFNLTIYNRWGETIWESNDPSVEWDGTYKGEIIPKGTYVWKVRTKDAVTDKKYEWEGHVNIIR